MKLASSPQLLALLPIDRTAGVALHRQIYNGFRRAILGGMLRGGQRVPSTRTLAAELEVSRLPVLTAYEQLLHEGYLTGRVGSGTFVSAVLPDQALRATPLGRPGKVATPKAQPRAKRAPAHDEGGLRPFRVSQPALDQFPRAEWARLVARHARALTPRLMGYGDPAGVEALRAAIAEHVRTARAVRCEADDVIVVSGSQAALRICASVLLTAGDRVALEEPGYPGARSALGTSGAEIVSVVVDDDGIDIEELLGVRPKLRAAYVTPSHQYPLGVSMSATRRIALIQWAQRNGAWLIEDDYDSEYRYVSRPLGALQGMDENGRVVYMGTFSKVLFPALRMGYLVVPPALRKDFIQAREAFDIFSPTLYQLVLADFLRNGYFARHLRRMRTLYIRRRSALLRGLAQHCAEHLEVVNADAGLHVVTQLRRGVNDVTIVKHMAERGLAGTALSECYAERHARSGLLLGFGGSSERVLLHATRTLGSLLDEMDQARSD
ncbi:MAG: PLP-dependent aminotransferase family protein [bacterium]